MTPVTGADLTLLDALQIRYLDSLDRKDMQSWLGTFAQDGEYVCTTLESETAGLPVALIMDDCRARLEDRVKFVDKVWEGTFQDYQTRHFVQRIECTLTEGGLYAVRSNFALTITRSDANRTELFAAGTYRDLVRVTDGAASFRAKRVVLDAPVLPHYVVYPL
jgi:anthranilate 1,2-dioxygenase small subunit